MRRFPRRDEAFGGKVPRQDPASSTASPGTAILRLGLVLVLALTAVAATPLAAADDGAATPPDGSLQEELTVTGTRLHSVPDDRLRVPAHVTVITRDTIERSGAHTLQDLLTSEAGIVVFDEIGNDVQKSFDLRGFRGESGHGAGDGTRVFLDGAPLNESRNNSMSLELIPLQGLDRIEITRGSVAALAGGGSEAGIINLWTRRGDGESGGAVSAAAGDFSTQEGRASGWHDFGAADLFLSGAYEETAGFRDNADGDLARFQGSLGWDLGAERRFSISVLRSDSDYGSPGSLTPAEIEADPEQAPFNQLDFIDEELGQATANFSSTLGRSLSLDANVFGRDRDDEILTTGRAAPAFGGFASESGTSALGSTVQIAHGTDTAGGDNRLIAGVEYVDGDTDTVGFFTSPSDPGTVDPFGLSSDNTAERRTLGLYAHDTWQANDHWTFAAGARWDDDRVGYDERFPDAANDADRDFSELSVRAGVSWSTSSNGAIYLAYGESFLPPTVEDLYAFPTFGSNPGLEPEDSASWELGYKRRFGDHLDLDATVFHIDSENEVVFDPFSPLGPFGANVNSGETRREGLELALRGHAGRRWRPFVTLTLIDAELQSGENTGNQLPLVPEERATAGVDIDIVAGLSLHAEGLHVGEQVLANDEANVQSELDAYDVVNLRAAWRPGSQPAGSGGARGRGFLVYVEARNVFDEEYATRGIYAFDFSTFVNETFLTPAPGRRFLGGVGWEF